jgi:hypothetical protein
MPFDNDAMPAIREFPWLESGPKELSYHIEVEHL